MKKKVKEKTEFLFARFRSGSRSRTPSPIAPDPNPVSDTSAPSTIIPDYAQPAASPTALATTGSVVHEFLAAAREGSDMCLPLKAALVGATKIFEICERTVEVKEQYKNLASRIAHLGAVTGALDKKRPIDADLLSQLEDIAKWIERLKVCVESKLARGVFKRVAESKADIDEIKDILSKISAYIEIFMFECVIGIRIGVDEILVRLAGLPTAEEKELEKEFAKWREVNKIIKSALGERRVPDAAHDKQPKGAGCMPGTRQGVLTKFVDWVKQNPKGILWLAGMAGTGKTSIAITLCRMLQEDQDVLLGGSFFCSRTDNMVARTDVRRIFPTLASLLASKSPEFALELSAELKPEMDTLAHGPVSDQLDPLFQRPLVALAAETRPIVFLIDALDECSNERELEELLEAIATLKTKANVKFILTSRPETSIFGSPVSDRARNEILQLHVIDRAEVTGDIRLYIADRFSKKPLAKTWYSDADVAALATLAGGLFIFASTIVSYILDTTSVDRRTVRLRKAVSAASQSTVAMDQLDAVYEFVLTRASDTTKIEPEEHAATQCAVASILAARTPLSAEAVAELLGMAVDSLRESFDRLRAAVHVPDEDDEPGVRTLHATFGDYLFERAPLDLRLSRSLGDETLARGCLEVMRARLHFNVSQSRSSYERERPAAPGNIPLALQYACLQWIYHVSGTPEPSKYDKEIQNIFYPGFLFWLEVMSVLGEVRRAAAMLIFAAATVQSAELVRFFRDASYFVASSREAIEAGPPHIYISALPFAAKDSVIYKTYLPLCTGLISVGTHGIGRHGGRHLMTLTGHEASVSAVSYSSDGRFLASGASDGTVRIWNPRTGEETMTPLRSGDGSVRSVVFAPNGEVVASGTDNGVLCIWTLSDHRSVPRKLRGPTKELYSVAFSPDGSLIASSAANQPVRLWSLETGQQISVLADSAPGTFSSNSRVKVAFSHDGKLVASGFTDNTVQLWHSAGGKLAGLPMKGHKGAVQGISFSPKGNRLASSCSSGDILLWDPRTRTKITTLGHQESVVSVEFSRDGRSLVSASWDHTVQLFNVANVSDDASDAPSVTLKGHTGRVNSATFSPDGLYVASASDDHTIRIWDADIGQPVAQPPGKHKSVMKSVAVSPDGGFIASGGEDGAVRVWDTIKVDQRYPPFILHTGPVHSVAISFDGRLIASASQDLTVRLWNPLNGDPVGEPIEGHTKGVTAIGFSPDSLLLASGSDDETVLIWSVGSGQRSTESPLEVRGKVSTVAFSPNGQILAANDDVGRINLWDTASYTRIGYPLQVIPNRFTSMVFSRDSTRIIAGAQDGEVFIWDLGTDQQTVLIGHTTRVSSIAVSLDGQLIGSASADGVIRLWDLQKEAFIAVIHGHTMPILSLAFTPDGKSIVSSSTDKTIRTWDIKEAIALLSREPRSPAVAVMAVGLDEGWIFSSAGERLLWIPAEYRGYIHVLPCTKYIGSRWVTIAADYRGWPSGTNWTSCWRKPSEDPQSGTSWPLT